MAMNLTWLGCVMSALGVASPARSDRPAPVNLRARAGRPVESHPRLRWKYARIMVEWGFKEGTEKLAFDGSIESTHLLGAVGKAGPPPKDKVTTMTGERAWRSPAGKGPRRGIVAPILFTDAVRGPGRTIVTVRTSSGSFSFQPVDLRHGPILAPEYGFFVRDVSQKQAKPAPAKASQARPPMELLKTKLNAIGGIPAVKGWGSKDTPVIYANPGPKPAIVMRNAITIPSRSVAVHPAPDRDVAVGWRSPIAGTVRVRAKVTDAHPSGGNGVEWSIVLDAASGRKVLVGGAIDRGRSQTIRPPADAARLAAVAVRPGDVVSLVIGARGSHVCDSTSVELTIAGVGGKGRTWDLAKDVVADIQAGNPHADSFGNAAVWHFHAPRRAPGQDFRVSPVTFESKATTAREYVEELAARKLRTIRQRVRQLPEQTWEAAMQAMHGKRDWPAPPKVPYSPKMTVEVPCKYLTALWRIGAWQIIKNCPRIHRSDLHKVGRSGDVGGCRRVGPKDSEGTYVVRDNPFPPLGCETDRILWALDHMGMHQVARDGMTVWLANQNTDGSLSLNSGMERAHKFGALHLPWAMAEHYRLTGDKDWLRKELPRLKAAADWIIQRRRTTMKKKLTQAQIDGIKAGTWSPYGLQPRITMGDGDPRGAQYFYVADASAYQSVRLLADVISEIDPRAGAELSAEADRYRRDILPVLEESLVLSPVIKTRAGTYRSFLPQGFQDRGPRAVALPEGVNIFSHCGPYSCDIVATSASIEAWLRSGLLSVDDPRIDGHFDVLEDVFLLDSPWVRRRTAGYDPPKQWFSHGGFGYQSGWERVPDFYLARDDIPNFLRSWLNRCAVDMNLRNWTFNEHTTFAHNDKSHGNAVFLSNFRRMLVMEVGQALWLARGTPRAWLKQGRKIAVRNAPTHFGTMAYEITSDVDNGAIAAKVELPSRAAPEAVLLRLRHPAAAAIRTVTVNGKPWRSFDKTKEAVRLDGLTGTVEVRVAYARGR